MHWDNFSAIILHFFMRGLQEQVRQTTVRNSLVYFIQLEQSESIRWLEFLHPCFLLLYLLLQVQRAVDMNPVSVIEVLPHAYLVTTASVPPAKLFICVHCLNEAE